MSHHSQLRWKTSSLSQHIISSGGKLPMNKVQWVLNKLCTSYYLPNFYELLKVLHGGRWRCQFASPTPSMIAFRTDHPLFLDTEKMDSLNDDTAQHRSPPLTRIIWLHFSPTWLVMMLMISVSKLFSHPVYTSEPAWLLWIGFLVLNVLCCVIISVTPSE
jgi:hypothetical protein